MKVTIKTANETKVVELSENIEFDAIKGQQFVFSNDFDNYVLNFKDNQESIELIFNADGKTIQVDLNGIVPLLQENLPNSENPTAIIINKNIDNESIDKIVALDEFNGSEILDRLEELASTPVELNSGFNDNLTLISDFNTLVESLGAAAAGGEDGPTGNTSTFDSILSANQTSLNGIADSDRWVNLSESVSTVPLDTGDDTTEIIPEVSISDATVNESDGVLTFTITLSEPTTNNVIVTLGTSDGTAKAIQDYVATNGTLFIDAGETSATFTVPVTDDNIYEQTENLNLNITDVANGTIADGQGEGTILDDDTPTLGVNGVEVVEGDYAVFTVDLSNPSSEDITVSLQLNDGSATQNDYINNTEVFVNGSWVDSNSATIPAGETSVKVRVKTNDDYLKENTESFDLEATVTTGTTTNSQATGTSYITDDISPTNPPGSEDTVYAEISVDKSSVAEGGELTYTVKLVDENGAAVNVPSGDSVNVQLDWSGAASGGADTSALPSNIDVTGGSEATFKVDAKDDYLNEGSEPLVATISGVTDTDSNFEAVEASSTNSVANSAIIDNDDLTILADAATVDEDALLNTDDTDGYNNEHIVTGDLDINTQLDTTLEFEGGQDFNLTSEGERVNLIYSNSNKTITGTSQDGREVFEISLDESQNKYTFELKDSIDHPTFNQEDLINSLDFSVIAKSENNDYARTDIKISIADDIATANDVNIDADSQYKETTSNLVIAIDTSGSMGNGSGSKMELAKEAAIKLIEKYEQMGDVNVKIVNFDYNATTTTWFTDSNAAKNSISNLTAGGTTNYEDTLRETMGDYDTTSDPKPTSDQDIFYMVSDGNPTSGDMNGADNNSGILDSWKDFAENNFDDVYSIGIGNNVDLDGNERGSLNEIADVENGHDTFVVNDANDLSDELLATIVNINGVLVVNNGTNELDFSFGADGPADGSGAKVDGGNISFTWGDTSSSTDLGIIVNNNDGTGPNLQWSTYNNGKVILGVDENSGKVLVKLEANNINSDNPTYEVTQFVPNTGIDNLQIPYTVVDGDGDGATANLSIDIDSSFSAFVKLTNNSSEVESDSSQLVHNLELVNQNGEPINLRAGQKVTVELEYTNDSTDANDFDAPKTILVEITGTVNGNNTAQVINDIKDDAIFEGSEGYTLSIKDITTNVTGLGTVQAHAQNTVTGEIVEDDSLNISTDTATVDEDALVNTADNDGYTTVKEVTKSYSFNTDLDVNVSFKDGQTTSLTSKGEAITLELSSDKKTIVGKAGSREVFELSINEANQEYKFTLKDVIDHTDTSSEDLESIEFLIDATTAAGDTVESININIADDIPELIGSDLEQVTIDNTQFKNLVINGSFEDVTGHKVSGSGGNEGFIQDKNISNANWFGMQALEGWELLSDSSMWMEPHHKNHAGTGSNDGDNALDLGETNSNDSDTDNTHIGQIIAGINDGQDYNLSFAFRDKALSQANESESGKMQVIWNGEVVATIDGNNNTWQSETVTITGGSGDNSNRLEFKEIGEGSDNWGIALDDISITSAEYVIKTASLADQEGIDINFGADGKGDFKLASKDGWTLDTDSNTLTKDDGSLEVWLNSANGEYFVKQIKEVSEDEISIPVVITDGDGDSIDSSIKIGVNNSVDEELPSNINVEILENDTVTEGDTLTHRIKLLDDNGNEVRVPQGEYVEVTLTYTASNSNGAIEGADYTSQNTVRVYGGTSGGYIFNDTINDAISEETESYTVSVSSVTASNPTLESKLTAGSDTVTGTIEDNDEKPIADEVITTSNLDTDEAVLNNFASDSNTPAEADIAFFKKLDIGGDGLDGDGEENNSSDPADLGGSDVETDETNLVFDITSLPTYGALYIEKDGQISKVTDVTTVDGLDTSDNIYWVATHDEVQSTSETKSIGGVYDSSIESSWDSSDVEIIARTGKNTESSITYSQDNGIGVSGSTGGPSSQLGYDANTQETETIIVDFNEPVTNGSIDITHLIKGESGGEVGVVTAYLDGKEVGTYTFSNASGVADITLVPNAIGNGNSAGDNAGTLNLPNIAFDQLEFSGQQYVNQNGTNDSSDYYIGEIRYEEIEGAEFEYKVIDEHGNESESEKVQINVNSDTEIKDISNIISLEAPANTDENATEVTYTIRVDEPVNGNLDVTVNVNGTPRVVTIFDGETTATFDVYVRSDDEYNQADDTIVAQIVDHNGGGYQNVSYDNSDNDVVISDDNDATTINTTAEVTEVHAIPHGISHVIYTLANGETVKVDGYGGDVKNPADPMKFIDSIESEYNQEVTDYIIKAAKNHYDSEGNQVADIPNQADNEHSYGHFDEDTSDVLTSAEVTYTLELSNEPQTDVTITTNHGEVVIKAGETTGTITVSSNGQDSSTLDVTNATGGNFEAINYNSGDLTVSIDNTRPVAEDRHFELENSILDLSTGLKSEYYGVDTQIDNLTEFKSIVASNNPDATFTATNIDYGYGTGTVSKGTNLQNFLKDDAASLSNDPGDTSDGGVHMYGKVYLEAGTYNFKVYADDGYDIIIDGNSVASYENNQSPSTKEHNEFTINSDGYYDIEMFWWDQGGEYVFKPEISSDGGNTYTSLDNSILFKEETSSTAQDSVEFNLVDYVADIEDDANSEIVKVRIESLPTEGVLTLADGTPVNIGDVFDETTQIKYTPNDTITETSYGTKEDTGTLSQWGTVDSNGILTTDDGKATIKAYANGQTIGFASENNNHNHDGLGLGVDSISGDDDQIDAVNDEKIVVEFDSVVSSAKIGLASLGGHFTPGASQDANAHWVAYKDGIEVASGDVKQSIDDSNPTTNSFNINVEFDKIEFNTDTDASNSNYSIQYMDLDYKVDDSFDYVSIDSKGLESDSATVSFDLDTLRNSTPDSINETNTLNVAEFNTNLVVTFDTSGSMDDKMDLAKEATINMINEYASKGNVKVLLTDFSSYGDTQTHNGSVWLSASKAIEFINDFDANGGTNYDDALQNVIQSMQSEPAPLEGQTISYFVSDGVPTYGMYDSNGDGTYDERDGNGYETTDVTDDLATQYKNLGFDETHSVGIGDSSTQTYLEEIALNGSSDVVIVNDANDLDATLADTIASSISGNVLENFDFKDESGEITSIIVDGVEYTQDSFPQGGVTTSEGGKFTFDFSSGDYTYTVKSSDISNDISKNIVVKAQDTTGDTTSMNLTLNVDVTPYDNAGQILVEENFENGASGWNINNTHNGGSEATNFLGRFGKGTIQADGSEQVYKTFDFGAEHAGQKVLIEFDMYEIDSWDANSFSGDGGIEEAFTVYTNESRVVDDMLGVDSHYNKDEKEGTTFNNNIDGTSGWEDESHHYSIEATLDSNGQVKLGFGATRLGEHYTNESFGIDNVTIKSGSNWENTLKVGEDGDDDTIDLSVALANAANSSDLDVVDMTNSNIDNLEIDIDDLLADSNNELFIKGDLADKVDLDDGDNSTKNWENSGKEEVDGVNYNVYQGTNANSTVKLLIDEDIDVNPDI